jgi:hypothetical protein
VMGRIYCWGRILKGMAKSRSMDPKAVPATETRYFQPEKTLQGGAKKMLESTLTL